MIAKKYQDFDAYFVNASAHFIQNWQRLRLTQAQYDSIRIGFGDWTGLYYFYLDDNTRTPETVKRMARTFAEYDGALRGVVRQIKNDRALTLTAADRLALRIHLPKPSARHPRPNAAPINTVLKTERGRVTFVVVNTIEPATRHPTRLPKNVARIGGAIAYGNTPPRTAYRALPDSGRMRFAVDTPAAGGDGYLITWFVNGRGEAGPESLPLGFAVV